MNIDDLSKRVSQMTEEELIEHLNRIRSERVIRTVPPKKAGAARVKQAKTKDALATLLGSLTPDQRAALLKKLEV